MAPGITLKSLENAASIIAQDNPPEKFNIATLWDFDSRAYPLRFLLTYNHKLKPHSVEEYKNIEVLYVFAHSSYNISDPHVYELNSFLPYKASELPSETQGFKLYKLTK